VTRRRPVQVYRLFDGDPGQVAIVRYSGDPDEYTAVAHTWLADQIGDGTLVFDYPIGVVAPRPRWFRMNPYNGDEYGWTLGLPSGPGRGNWFGSFLTVTAIGCSQCQYLHGAHHPAGCLNADIDGLITLQFGGQRVSDRHPLSRLTVHAVRSRRSRPGLAGGTPGPTLCDIDRFFPDGPGWSVGGGVMGPGMKFHACYLCGQVARRDFPGLAISGSLQLAQAFAADTGVPLAGHLLAAQVAKTGLVGLVEV